MTVPDVSAWRAWQKTVPGVIWRLCLQPRPGMQKEVGSARPKLVRKLHPSSYENGYSWLFPHDGKHYVFGGKKYVDQRPSGETSSMFFPSNLFLPLLPICLSLAFAIVLLWLFSRSVVSDFVTPRPVACLWDSSGKNIGVGCHFLLQEIFPTQGLNSCLLHCRQILYH